MEGKGVCIGKQREIYTKTKRKADVRDRGQRRKEGALNDCESETECV